MEYSIYEKIPMLVIGPLILLLHLCNIWMIISKKKLHTPSYYLIINLSFGDIILSLVGSFNLYFFDYRNKVLYIPGDISYNVSILTTVCISVDRYIAIRFCLNYCRIVTKIRLLYLETFLWTISVMLGMLPLFEVPTFGKDGNYRRLSYDVTHYTIVLSSCVFLISLSLHTVYIRRNLVKRIMRRTRSHIQQTETKDIAFLPNLKRSLKDVLMLNMLTVILVLLSNMLKAYNEYIAPTNKLLSKIKMTSMAIYIISNPILYALIMRDLRKQYVVVLKNVSIFSLSKRKNSSFTLSRKSRYCAKVVTFMHEGISQTTKL